MMQVFLNRPVRTTLGERTHYPELEDIFGRITPKGGRSTSAAAPSSYVRGV